MDRREVGRVMANMATHSPEFKTMYDFFTELGGCDEQQYIRTCRARMAHVADALQRGTQGRLAESSILHSMRNVHALTDGQVVQLSAVALELITKAIAKAITA